MSTPNETLELAEVIRDAIQVIAAWLREIDAAEAVVSPSGGAAFHARRKSDELLAGWEAAEQRAKRAEASAAYWQRQHTVLAQIYEHEITRWGGILKDARQDVDRERRLRARGDFDEP
jgi:hypothetical protein